MRRPQPAPRTSTPAARGDAPLPVQPTRPNLTPARFGMAATGTDKGRRQPGNEDAVLGLPDVPIYAIADGSGALWPAGLTLRVLGEQAPHLNEFQAKVANEHDTSSRLAVGHFFESVFNTAGRMVKEEMGKRMDGRATSAVVALTLMGPFAYIAHVGDARAYLFRDHKLRCLTTDQTLAMLQLKRGEISEEEYRDSPYKKTLTQAIGVTPEIRPDIAEVRLAHGDLILLCSDGLHRMVPDKRIAEILGEGGSIYDLVKKLINAANEAGGKDNISVQLVPVESAVGQPGSARPSTGSEAQAVAAGASKTAAAAESTGVNTLTGPAKKERVDVARVLGKCFLFEKISEAERLVIAPYFEYQAFEPGDTICREGDPGDSLYVVVQGRLRITFQRAHLIDIGPGGWAGEIALAREGPRTATLTSRDKAVVLVLTRARFLEIMRRRPELGSQLALPLLEFVGQRVIDLRLRLARIGQLMHGQQTDEPTS